MFGLAGFGGEFLGLVGLQGIQKTADDRQRVPQIMDDHLREVVVKFFHPSQLQMGSDAGIDFFILKRLRHVVHSAPTERLHLVDRLIQRADKNDGDILQRCVGLELLADFVSGHVWHGDVEPDQVGPFVAGSLQRHLTVGNRPRLVTFVG